MRIVSWNLQHGVPDPVGRPALGARRARAARRWPPTSTRSRSSIAAGCGRGSRTRRAVLAEALDGELLWARAKHRLWASQSNALVVRGEVLERRRRRAARRRGAARGGRWPRSGPPAERWSVATTHLSLEPGRRPPPAAGDARRAGGSGPSRGCWSVTSTCCPAQLARRCAEAAGYDLVDGPFTDQRPHAAEPPPRPRPARRRRRRRRAASRSSRAQITSPCGPTSVAATAAT